MLKPLNINKYRIYDIFYSHDHLYIITPQISGLNLSINKIKPHVFHCPHRHFTLYDFTVEDLEFYNLSINGSILEIKPSRYPDLQGKNILTALVKNEDSYICQWIDYNLNLGFDHIVIYDNAGIDDKDSWCSRETESDLPNLLNNYISSGVVTLIQWPFPKRLDGLISGQVTQQNHALYSFKNCNYIGFLDIDEYLNPKFENLSCLLSSLSHSINSCNYKIRHRGFYNPYNLDETGNNFLKIFTCEDVLPESRSKLLIKPCATTSVAIHDVTAGIRPVYLNKNTCYFNHYFFLNKSNRGRENGSYFIDKSITRHIINV